MLVELGLEDFGENFDGFLGNVFHEILTNNFIFMGGFFFQDGSYSYNSDLELGQVSVHHRISSQRGRQGGRFSQAACV